ncbi:Protein of unknown function [Pyronema omphalodes CBS 100304]|uniref:Uncharacterized protein n=1 Tax=Pyronema omphalodes (strain CBS 100304) TaxID=1076935 RepID=U4L3N4_PYROM|nr:Protein of unknown function [Pyronema omphalodes CBS 100304]
MGIIASTSSSQKIPGPTVKIPGLTLTTPEPENRRDFSTLSPASPESPGSPKFPQSPDSLRSPRITEFPEPSLFTKSTKSTESTKFPTFTFSDTKDPQTNEPEVMYKCPYCLFECTDVDIALGGLPQDHFFESGSIYCNIFEYNITKTLRPAHRRVEQLRKSPWN